MKDEELFNLDFNSLKVLKVLGEEENTKRAAERLYVTQSAVSKALSRLREQFDDDLFTRGRDGLEPTEKCARLLNKLPSIMTGLDELYGEINQFSPANYEGTIRIHINSILCYGTMTKLFETLHRLAPKATIVLENWSAGTEFSLRKGSVDVGLNFYPLEVAKDISQIPICYPEFKICCHEDSPLAKAKSITVEDAAKYPLVLAIQPHFVQKESYVVNYFKKRGYSPNILLRSDKVDICLETIRKIPSFMAVSEVVKSQLFEELTLIDINHWEEINHRPIACYMSYKFRSTPFSKWLVHTIQEAIEELY
ncbi:LysR family transcriptional regulator [Photobacterium satsumensis]|uniref:LysR family transcriptional regulator n=1 Tax=Photobacterium satsumensis TaxID=2910239 RepID=UPI003D11A96E